MASWMTASEEGEVCPVCIDFFEDPVNLPCSSAHSFCVGCLESLIQKQEGKQIVKCPMCYEITELKGNKQNFFGLTRNESLKASAEKKKEKVESNKPLDGQGLGSFEELLSAIQNVDKCVAPRNIKLLEEYDLAIGKDGKTNIPPAHMGMIMYGIDKEPQLDDTDEYVKLSNWRAILIGPQESPIGAVIYNLAVEVGDGYPLQPPIVRFSGPKVKMPAVNNQGIVDLSKLEGADMNQLDSEGMVSKGTGKMFRWDPHEHDIIDCLVAVRENLHIKAINEASSSVASSSY